MKMYVYIYICTFLNRWWYIQITFSLPSSNLITFYLRWNSNLKPQIHAVQKIWNEKFGCQVEIFSLKFWVVRSLGLGIVGQGAA